MIIVSHGLNGTKLNSMSAYPCKMAAALGIIVTDEDVPLITAPSSVVKLCEAAFSNLKFEFKTNEISSEAQTSS